jgi:2-phospho-L-lactate guanylyltransferase
MRAILIPVKLFGAAKMRLAERFSADDRATLAAALCQDAFATVAEVHGAERVYVASQEPLALDWARARGWKTIAETEQVSESVSVDAASAICDAEGVAALLRLPIDIPLAEPEDIEAILAAAPSAPSAVLVPSQEGTGTNALLRSPPTLFPSRFGPNSFRKHVAEAGIRGAALRVVHNERIGLDIDDGDDLERVVGRLRAGSATHRWCVAHGLTK